mgnify:CR=1 FL=1
MTRYKFRIDTPWGKKGEIAMHPTYSFGESNEYAPVSMEHFPDLFEIIPEPDPVEKVANFLAEKDREWHSEQRHWNYENLARLLIDAGLDPEKLCK